jgi:hypothetical protein
MKEEKRRHRDDCSEKPNGVLCFSQPGIPGRFARPPHTGDQDHVDGIDYQEGCQTKSLQMS